MFGTKRYHQHGEASSGDNTPPLDIDPAQESLSQALQAGFNVLRVIMAFLLCAYFLSGLFQVNAGEQGLIVRFGQLLTNKSADSEYQNTPIFGEGWHFSWPDPIDEKIRVSGQIHKPKIYTFCFQLEKDQYREDISQINLSEIVPYSLKLEPGKHCVMLTGDRNLAYGLFAVEYRIDDAASFVQNVGETTRDLEPLLRRLAENAIVHTVAGMPVERVIRTQTDESSGDFTLAVKRRLSEELTALNTGVTVVRVEAETIEPGSVRAAFIQVLSAKSDRQRDFDSANQEYNRILSEAAGSNYKALLDKIEEYGAAQAAGADEARLSTLRDAIDTALDKAEGKVAARLRLAASKANQIRERVGEEYELFVNYRDLYRKHPELTAVRLWVRMREAVLSSNDNELFFVPKVGELEIITNRDLQRRIEADINRYKNRYKTN